MRVQPIAASQNRRIVAGLPFVEALARRMAASMPNSIDIGDLVQDGVLGLIDAALGRKDEAIREGRHAIELLPITKDSIDGAELVKYMGVIYAWCGEKDLAIEQIEATLKIPSTLSYGNLKLHPTWDPLRGDPRFEKIVTDLAPQNPEK